MKPRQARWALFFTGFNLILSYRPGSQNVKADALSCKHGCLERGHSQDSLFPETAFWHLLAGPLKILSVRLYTVHPFQMEPPLMLVCSKSSKISGSSVRAMLPTLCEMLGWKKIQNLF